MPSGPICRVAHPTGRFTATYGGLRHRSHECGQAASNAGVNRDNIADPRIKGMLRAIKERYETEGLPDTCPRCGYFAGDGDNCAACGLWTGT